MYIVLHVKYRLLLSNLTKLEISRQIFETNFMKSPSSGSRDVPCGRTDREKEMKPIINPSVTKSVHEL